jgi:hypothetical protein
VPTPKDSLSHVRLHSAAAQDDWRRSSPSKRAPLYQARGAATHSTASEQRKTKSSFSRSPPAASMNGRYSRSGSGVYVIMRGYLHGQQTHIRVSLHGRPVDSDQVRVGRGVGPGPQLRVREP